MIHEAVEVLVPISFMYKNRVGRYLQHYLNGLKEKKILGSKCSGCGRVVVPPRSACGRCCGVMDELVELPQEGKLVNWTVCYVKLEGGEFKRIDPYIIGMIQLDGCDSLLSAKVLDLQPENVKIGMRVKALWKEETTGDYTDLVGFIPL